MMGPTIQWFRSVNVHSLLSQRSKLCPWGFVFIVFVIIVHSPLFPLLSSNWMDQYASNDIGSVSYTINEQIPLVIQTVGPFNNAHEKYDLSHGYEALSDSFPFFCSVIDRIGQNVTVDPERSRTTTSVYSTTQHQQSSDPSWLPFRIYGPSTDLGFHIQLLDRQKAHGGDEKDDKQSDISSSFQQTQQECTTKPLSTSQFQNLQFAIRDRWFYQLDLGRRRSIPDISLPVWAMVGEILPESTTTTGTITTPATTTSSTSYLFPFGRGEMTSTAAYIYTRRHLTIHFCQFNCPRPPTSTPAQSTSHNNHYYYQIIRADLTNDVQSLQKLKVGSPLTFYLDVSWMNGTLTDDKCQSSADSWKHRWDVYMDEDYAASRWNNVVMGMILVGILVTVLVRMDRQQQQQGQSQLRLPYDKKRSSDIIIPATSISDHHTSLRKPLLHDTNQSSTGGGGNSIDDLDTGITTKATDLLDEPPALPLMAALIGTGSQILLMSGLVVYYASFRSSYTGYLSMGGNARSFLSSLWIAWLFISSFVAGYVSTSIVLLYARPSKIQSDILDVFEGELMLELNTMTNEKDDDYGIGQNRSTDDDEYEKIPLTASMAFHDRSSNDEEIYVTRMLQWSIGWTVSIVPILNLVVGTAVGMSAVIRGVYLGIHVKGVVVSIVCWVLVGTMLCIAGSTFAQRQSTRLRQGWNLSSTESTVSVSQNSYGGRGGGGGVSSMPINISILTAGLVSSLPLCQEMSGFIFESYWNYKMYIPSASILCVYIISIATVFLTSQITVSHIVRGNNNQILNGRRNWQWISFWCGGSTSIFVVLIGLYRLYSIQPGISGWYEHIHSLLLILLLGVYAGLAIGSISYWSGYVTIKSYLQHKSSI